ncbi:hypothetical protein VKT23_013932 [Stygiomarasmius scandens]|uniref:Uncharacterized protein n=1 Tax=Marasmiellus scandens TaxID=2682957 RepID=A0ABR1J410_9AGAR
MPRCPCTLTSSPYELALPVDPFGHSGSRSGGNSEDVGVVSPQQTLGPMALKVEDNKKVSLSLTPTPKPTLPLSVKPSPSSLLPHSRPRSMAEGEGVNPRASSFSFGAIRLPSSAYPADGGQAGIGTSFSSPEMAQRSPGVSLRSSAYSNALAATISSLCHETFSSRAFHYGAHEVPPMPESTAERASMFVGGFVSPSLGRLHVTTSSITVNTTGHASRLFMLVPHGRLSPFGWRWGAGVGVGFGPIRNVVHRHLSLLFSCPWYPSGSGSGGRLVIASAGVAEYVTFPLKGERDRDAVRRESVQIVARKVCVCVWMARLGMVLLRTNWVGNRSSG